MTTTSDKSITSTIMAAPLMIPVPLQPQNELAVRCLSQLHGYYNGRNDVGRRVAYANALRALLNSTVFINTIQLAAATQGIGSGSMGYRHLWTCVVTVVLHTIIQLFCLLTIPLSQFLCHISFVTIPLSQFFCHNSFATIPLPCHNYLCPNCFALSQFLCRVTIPLPKFLCLYVLPVCMSKVSLDT